LTGLLTEKEGALSIPISEGPLSQQVAVIANDRNLLIAIVYAPMAEGDLKESVVLVAIDLATNKVAWKVIDNEPPIYGVFSLALSSHGDVFVTANRRIMVVNAADGTLKRKIPVEAVGIT